MARENNKKKLPNRLPSNEVGSRYGVVPRDVWRSRDPKWIASPVQKVGSLGDCPWTLDPSELYITASASRYEGSYCSSLGRVETNPLGLPDMDCLALTVRHLGAHVLMRLDEKKEHWKAQIWLLPGSVTSDSYWLSSVGYSHGIRDPFRARTIDKPLQDLAIACLDTDVPDATIALEPHRPLDTLPYDDPHAAADAVLEALRNAIISVRISHALGNLSDLLGENFTVSASILSRPSRVILSGTFHDYQWILSGGTALSVVPPSQPPQQSWWQADYHSLYDTWNYPTDQELPEVLRRMFNNAQPSPWRYWFKETHRGRRLLNDPPAAIFYDGTPLAPGTGHNPEEAYEDANRYLDAWINANPWRYSSRSGRTFATLGSGKRKRHRGSKGRRDERVDLDPSPVFTDPRDYRSFESPSTLIW